MLSTILYYFISFSLMIHCSHSDLVATDPEFVPIMERNIANVIHKFINTEYAKLEYLERLEEHFQSMSSLHENTPITDPINLYLSVKKIFYGWNQIAQIMKTTSYIDSIWNTRLPVNEDVNEMVFALFRIQDTYQLDTKELASGLLSGLRLDQAANLSGADCYDIGMRSDQSDSYHALLWLQEAQSRVSLEPIPSITEMEILPSLISSLDKTGNHIHAVHETTRLRQLLDKKENVEVNNPNLKVFMEESKRMQIDQGELPPISNQRTDGTLWAGQREYEDLCRGKMLNEVSTSSLQCFYKRTSAFLHLAPVKIEIVSRTPPIIIYHSIISDNEAETVKTLVRNQMVRSRVAMGNSTSGQVNQARTSSSGWLYDKDDPAVADIRRRIGIVTELSMETAEGLQVTRYGLGGHYAPHYDHSSLGYATNILLFKEDDDGDRIATFMLYLEQPEMGGSTAFPYAGVAVAPVKNSAVFWYNLKRSGVGDNDTLHAGCPVVSGVKWVANQWIREHGEVFDRPCSLNEHE